MGELGGEVTSIKFFVGKNSNAIDENGLLSESIFGPVRDFKCRCGKLSIESCDKGKICDRCGVLCASSELRLKTFGKITLVFPIIKPTKIRKYFNKIVGSQHKHLLDPKKADALAATSRYLSISLDGKTLKVVNALSPAPMGTYVVPIRITGLYSFILSLRFLAEVFGLEVAKELFEKKYITDVIKVLPPDIRPVVRDPKNKKEFRYVKVNKHYISLINQNNLNKSSREIARQKEQDWFERIKYNIQNDVEDEIVDPIIPEYDRATARYQYYVDLIYESVFESISGKTGFIRGSILGKTIEFSARSVIVVDPSLEPYEVKVSRKILYKLWFPYFLNYLHRYKKIDFGALFDNYAQFEDYEMHKTSFSEFLEWFCSEDNNKITDEDLPESVNALIVRRKIECEEDDEMCM
jgi:DNA-directed RNA polymerase subunit beta'